MLETILGAILGTITSVIITHTYYRRASQDLRAEVDALRGALTRLTDISSELQGYSEEILKTSELTKKHVVQGTTDDPEYPYK